MIFLKPKAKSAKKFHNGGPMKDLIQTTIGPSPILKKCKCCDTYLDFDNTSDYCRSTACTDSYLPDNNEDDDIFIPVIPGTPEDPVVPGTPDSLRDGASFCLDETVSPYPMAQVSSEEKEWEDAQFLLNQLTEADRRDLEAVRAGHSEYASFVELYCRIRRLDVVFPDQLPAESVVEKPIRIINLQSDGGVTDCTYIDCTDKEFDEKYL